MKRIVLLCIISLSLCLMAGCGCRYFGVPEVEELGMICKYKPGAELPEYYHTYKSYLRRRHPTDLVLYPLVNGYYISFGFALYSGWEYREVVVMNFTRDDYYAGNVPEDWLDNWEEYVMVENPFMEGWALPIYICEENGGVPYYCKECTSTNNVDTACLNRMIESGELWEHIFCRYRDTIAMEEERR